MRGDFDFLFIRPFMLFLEKKGALQRFRKMFTDYMKMGDQLFTCPPYSYVTKAFNWWGTSEGSEYWAKINDEWLCELDMHVKNTDMCERERDRFKRERYESFEERREQINGKTPTSGETKPQTPHAMPSTIHVYKKTDPIILAKLTNRALASKNLIKIA